MMVVYLRRVCGGRTDAFAAAGWGSFPSQQARQRCLLAGQYRKRQALAVSCTAVVPCILLGVLCLLPAAWACNPLIRPSFSHTSLT